MGTTEPVPAVETTTNADSGVPPEVPPEPAASAAPPSDTAQVTETLTGQDVQYTGLTARFHKEAIAVFFDSADKPNWDDGLYNNIKNAKYSKAAAVITMRNIVKAEGPMILVSDVITGNSKYSESDAIMELNEILQLHFSLHRNMSRGPRVTKVGISLNQLLGTFDAANVPADAGTGAPGGAGTDTMTTGGDSSIAAGATLPSTVVTDTSIEEPLDGIFLPVPPAAPDLSSEDTTVDLATAWNNRKYGMGATSTGLRRLPVVPQMRLDVPSASEFGTGSSASVDPSGALFRAFAARGLALRPPVEEY